MDLSKLDATLALAVQRGDLRDVEDALQAGANAGISFGGLPLVHIAASRSNQPSCCSILRLLLEDDRVDPNARESYGGTPLILALEETSHRAHVGILLEHGADPSLVDDGNMNAFDYALYGSKKPDMATLKHLLDHSFKNSPPASPRANADNGAIEAACANLEKLRLDESGDSGKTLKDADVGFCQVEHGNLLLPGEDRPHTCPGCGLDWKTLEQKELAQERICRFALEGDAVSDDGTFYSAKSLSTVSSEIKALSDKEKSIIQQKIKQKKAEAGLRERSIPSNLSDVDWLQEKRKWLPETEEQKILNTKYPFETCYLIRNFGFVDISHLYEPLEVAMVTSLEKTEEPGKRGGCSRTCFNYLLLDSRVTQNLPVRDMPPSEKFCTFVKAIFYVGKGQKNRPYQHFQEAVTKGRAKNPVLLEPKVKKINEIWDDKAGVVSLHVFHSQLHNEALTREAVMIDAIGLPNLTNAKLSHKHGIVRQWPKAKQRCLGAFLLLRAFNILLNEGERAIMPRNV